MRAALLLLVVAACGSSARDASDRDAKARVAAARPDIDACYDEALKIDPAVKGTIVVTFTAAQPSGEFQNIEIKSDDIGSPDLQTCLIQKLSALKLSTPTATAQTFEYPFHFGAAAPK
jgi:hypothetical protein